MSPEQTGADEVRAFLEYLAIRRQVSASTQNQALNALVFLYDKVPGRELGILETFSRARRSRNLPVVLSRPEVSALLAGHGEVILPGALHRKYLSAGHEQKWQFLFPSGRLSVDPHGGKIRGHHLHESTLQKAVKQATRLSGINKRIGCHTLRHCFATVKTEAPNSQYSAMQPNIPGIDTLAACRSTSTLYKHYARITPPGSCCAPSMHR